MIKGYTENNGMVQMNQNDRMCNKNYKFIKFQQFSECWIQSVLYYDKVC